MIPCLIQVTRCICMYKDAYLQYTRIYIYTHITYSSLVHIHTHVYVYMYMCIYVYIYIYVCIYICICIYVYMYMYIYIDICIYVYVYCETYGDYLSYPNIPWNPCSTDAVPTAVPFWSQDASPALLLEPCSVVAIRTDRVIHEQSRSPRNIPARMSHVGFGIVEYSHSSKTEKSKTKKQHKPQQHDF